MGWVDDFKDDLSLVGTAFADFAANANPFGEEFLSGQAWRTALEAEIQNAKREGREPSIEHAMESARNGISKIKRAGVKTVDDVADSVKSAANSAPVFIAVVGALVLLVVLAPYVARVK